MPRILIVEDNEMNRDMISRRLARKGYETCTAVSGREGIEAARSERPDLILMDLSLPEIDGWEATRRLKSDPATSAIPIIALTAHAMAGDREKAMEAGCDEYAAKPVDLPDLLKKIASLLGGGSSPEPVLDLATVRGIADECGWTLREFAAMYGPGTLKELAAMEAALGRGDMDDLGRRAHGVVGSSTASGITSMAPICRRIEAAAGSGDPGPIAALLSEARAQLERVEASLARAVQQAS